MDSNNLSPWLFCNNGWILFLSLMNKYLQSFFKDHHFHFQKFFRWLCLIYLPSTGACLRLNLLNFLLCLIVMLSLSYYFLFNLLQHYIDRVDVCRPRALTIGFFITFLTKSKILWLLCWLLFLLWLWVYLHLMVTFAGNWALKTRLYRATKVRLLSRVTLLGVFIFIMT